MEIKEKVLEVIDLSKSFYTGSRFSLRRGKKIKAVDRVTLFLYKGKTLGLVGESGCGKSTLCKLILRFLPIDQGKVFFKGEDITFLSEKEFRHRIRKKIQIVFQDPYSSLNPRLKIGSTLKDGVKVRGLSGEKCQKRVEELLELVGLSFKDKDRYPHEFSGGQRQRICIARALSVDPEIILCDEPVSALDVSVQAQILNLFKDLQKRFGLSYLFISHDLNVVGYISDFIAVMYRGEVVEYSSCEELFCFPLHPYTRNLLNASLNLNIESINIWDESEEGETETGCKFIKRCPHSFEMCKKKKPKLIEKRKNHLVRCFLYGIN